jgi:hypothetical protein
VPNHRRPARRCSYFEEKTVECTRPYQAWRFQIPTYPVCIEIAVEISTQLTKSAHDAPGRGAQCCHCVHCL